MGGADQNLAEGGEREQKPRKGEISYRGFGLIFLKKKRRTIKGRVMQLSLEMEKGFHRHRLTGSSLFSLLICPAVTLSASQMLL